MSTTLTAKGQVTIPKQIRDALNLKPGSQLDFALNDAGQVILRKVGEKSGRKTDRFESVRGKAEIRWRTDDLMALLRAD